MSETRSDLRAGSVIIAGLILLALILAAVSKAGSLFAKKEKLRIHFSDVQGLKVDDPVQIMGLESGRVIGIRVDSYVDSAGMKVPAVEVSLEVEATEALPVDTKFSVDRSLTGTTVLKIEPGRLQQKLNSQQIILGQAPVGMTELANKAGLIATRLDEFITDFADKNLSGAIRSAAMNVKEITENAKRVTGSLSADFPATSKNLSDGMRNFEQVTGSLKQALSGNEDKLKATIQSVSELTTSLVKVSAELEELLKTERSNLHATFANLAKASENVKTVSREVRWQPWVLLNKPDEVEIAERSTYNSALELSEGAAQLRDAALVLGQLMSEKSRSSQPVEISKLLEEMKVSLQKANELEHKLWKNLHDRTKK